MEILSISQSSNNSNDYLFGTDNQISEQDINFNSYNFNFIFFNNLSENENIANTILFNNQLYFHTNNNHHKVNNLNNKNIKNSYRFDFARRKLKILVLNNVFQFIKGKIKHKYQLHKIAHQYKKEMKIDEEKKFMQKTLGDIFSCNISDKYSTIKDKKNFNKKKIDEMKNCNVELKNIFDITFIKCLNYFIEKEELNLLKGMQTFGQAKFKDEKEKEYISYIAENYENEINKRNSRDKK